MVKLAPRDRSTSMIVVLIFLPRPPLQLLRSLIITLASGCSTSSALISRASMCLIIIGSAVITSVSIHLTMSVSSSSDSLYSRCKKDPQPSHKLCAKVPDTETLYLSHSFSLTSPKCPECAAAFAGAGSAAFRQHLMRLGNIASPTTFRLLLQSFPNMRRRFAGAGSPRQFLPRERKDEHTGTRTVTGEDLESKPYTTQRVAVRSAKLSFHFYGVRREAAPQAMAHR